MANMTKKEIEVARRKNMTLLLMVGGLFLLYMTFSFFFGDMGLVKLVQMWETRKGLQTEISSLKTENDRLTREAQALKNDPRTIESVAREKLGMTRKGEIVYQYEKTAPAGKPAKSGDR